MSEARRSSCWERLGFPVPLVRTQEIVLASPADLSCGTMQMQDAGEGALLPTRTGCASALRRVKRSGSIRNEGVCTPMPCSRATSPGSAGDVAFAFGTGAFVGRSGNGAGQAFSRLRGMYTASRWNTPLPICCRIVSLQGRESPPFPGLLNRQKG
jgi:hypothetical protein